jgi:hypothetical protein
VRYFEGAAISTASGPFLTHRVSATLAHAVLDLLGIAAGVTFGVVRLTPFHRKCTARTSKSRERNGMVS